MRTRMQAAACAAAFLILSGTSAAQTNYPVKPIRIVIGTPAGGGSEITARMPLQFEAGTGRKSLALDCSELYDLKGMEEGISPRCRLTLEIMRKDGTRIAVPVTCRLDTDEEIAYFRAGGLLPMMCEQLLRAA